MEQPDPSSVATRMSKPEHRRHHGMLLSVANIFSIACILAIMYFVLFHGTSILPVPGG
jgi:hypothetical protein